MITRSLQKKIAFNKGARYIFYDLETSGFNPYHNDVIEIGAIDNYGNTFSMLIKIENKLRNKIVDITGIDNNMLNTHGVLPKNAFTKFIRYINKYGDTFKNSTYLIAHNNNSFDKLFINYQCEKHHLEFPKYVKYVDTLRLAQLILKKIPYYNMKYLANYFNINNDNHHRALNDCIVLKKIFAPLLIIFNQLYKCNDLDYLIYKLDNPFSNNVNKFIMETGLFSKAILHE